MEAIGFRDLKHEFEALNTAIIGISKDDLKSHAKFRDKNDLNFLLLSDETGEIHELFKVIVPKKMYGKEYMGTERSTFVFDENGELIREYRKVKAEGHAEEVLAFIKERFD